MTQATTWRVLLHSANQIQRLRAFWPTNDHSSSSSRRTAFGSSGSTSVLFSGGSAPAFFKPLRQGISRHSECSYYPTHTGTFLISLDDLFLARFAIAKVRLLPARLTAPPTLILLLPVGRFSVLDKLIAATVIALDDFAYHPLAYQSLLSHYQTF